MKETTKSERRTKRCVVYCRVSSEEQARGQYTSVEAQEDRCLHAIAMKQDQGWVHVATIKDPGYSGKDMNRPGVQDLIRKVKAGEVDVVLTYRIDRLSRSILAFYDFYGILQARNIELFSLTESFDTSTTVGRLMLNIILSFAQYERELAQERTLHKMQQHAERGQWNGGMVPFGYALDLKSEKGERRLVVAKQEARIIQSIYELYLELQNVSAVCKALHKSSVLSRTRVLRMRDGSEKILQGKPFYKTRVIDILQNPIYIGQIRYGDKIYPGKHEAIVSEKDFKSVQRLLELNARKPRLISTRDDHVHLLKGVLRCGSCKMALTPYPSGKKDPKTGQPYLYYGCTAPIHNGRTSKCPLPLFPARAFENTIKEFLKAVCLNSDKLAESIREDLKDSSSLLAPLQKKRASAINDHKKIEKQISNYLDAIGQGGLGSADLRDRYERTVKRRDELNRELEQLNSEIASAEHRVLDLGTIRENLKAFQALIDEVSLEDQKQLFQLFIRNVTVWPHEEKTKTPPDEPGAFLTGLDTTKGRKSRRIYRVQVELNQIPGLNLPTATELKKFGFRPARLPGEDSNLQHTG